MPSTHNSASLLPPTASLLLLHANRALEGHFWSCQPEGLDVCLAVHDATPRALAVAVFQVLLDALVAEYVAALGDDDILLTLMTHIAVQQPPHRVDLLLQLPCGRPAVGDLAQALHL